MAAFVLKVKTKEQQYIIRNFTAESTVKELKNHLAEISKIPNSKIQILSGYPPKILDTSQDSFNLSACGVKSGDTLILEVKQSVAQPMKNDVSEQKTNRAHTSDVQLNSPGILMKYVVPADNSCLFTSINFVLSGKVDDTGTVSPWMRKIIAETVAADIENYSEAILGKPNTEYCNWILDDKSWGGAIEIAIMSDYYGMEIAVVDTINAIINRFGEDRDYPHRVFLLFDGIHYDPLYMESLDVSSFHCLRF